jgi:hypothetical protein
LAKNNIDWSDCLEVNRGGNQSSRGRRRLGPHAVNVLRMHGYDLNGNKEKVSRMHRLGMNLREKMETAESKRR